MSAPVPHWSLHITGLGVLSPLGGQHEAGRLGPRPLHSADGLPPGLGVSTNDPVLRPVITVTSSHNDPEVRRCQGLVMIIIRSPGVHSAHAGLPGQVEAAIRDLLITNNSGTWRWR